MARYRTAVTEQVTNLLSGLPVKSKIESEIPTEKKEQFSEVLNTLLESYTGVLGKLQLSIIEAVKQQTDISTFSEETVQSILSELTSLSRLAPLLGVDVTEIISEVNSFVESLTIVEEPDAAEELTVEVEKTKSIEIDARLREKYVWFSKIIFTLRDSRDKKFLDFIDIDNKNEDEVVEILFVYFDKLEKSKKSLTEIFDGLNNEQNRILHNYLDVIGSGVSAPFPAELPAKVRGKVDAVEDLVDLANMRNELKKSIQSFEHLAAELAHLYFCVKNYTETDGVNYPDGKWNIGNPIIDSQIEVNGVRAESKIDGLKDKLPDSASWLMGITKFRLHVWSINHDATSEMGNPAGKRGPQVIDGIITRTETESTPLSNTLSSEYIDVSLFSGSTGIDSVNLIAPKDRLEINQAGRAARIGMSFLFRFADHLKLGDGSALHGDIDVPKGNKYKSRDATAKKFYESLKSYWGSYIKEEGIEDVNLDFSLHQAFNFMRILFLEAKSLRTAEIETISEWLNTFYYVYLYGKDAEGGSKKYIAENAKLLTQILESLGGFMNIEVSVPKTGVKIISWSEMLGDLRAEYSGPNDASLPHNDTEKFMNGPLFLERNGLIPLDLKYTTDSAGNVIIDDSKISQDYIVVKFDNNDSSYREIQHNSSKVQHVVMRKHLLKETDDNRYVFRTDLRSAIGIGAFKEYDDQGIKVIRPETITSNVMGRYLQYWQGIYSDGKPTLSALRSMKDGKPQVDLFAGVDTRLFVEAGKAQDLQISLLPDALMGFLGQRFPKLQELLKDVIPSIEAIDLRKPNENLKQTDLRKYNAQLARYESDIKKAKKIYDGVLKSIRIDSRFVRAETDWFDNTYKGIIDQVYKYRSGAEEGEQGSFDLIRKNMHEIQPMSVDTEVYDGRHVSLELYKVLKEKEDLKAKKEKGALSDDEKDRAKLLEAVVLFEQIFHSILTNISLYVYKPINRKPLDYFPGEYPETVSGAPVLDVFKIRALEYAVNMLFIRTIPYTLKESERQNVDSFELAKSWSNNSLFKEYGLKFDGDKLRIDESQITKRLREFLDKLGLTHTSNESMVTLRETLNGIKSGKYSTYLQRVEKEKTDKK